MIEFGMSALVLKICQEYAQATGLNFPPCVQQELNAVAQWVNTHTVKDLKISQDANVLTFTFDQDKEVTFTVELPEEYVLNVDDLSNLIKGSSTVVVDKSADGKTLEVRLDKSQEVQYITLSPDSATQGTLTVEQFTALQLNKGNCIILNNEIYRLADNQHTTGVISYVHTGWDSNIVNKSINITVSTRAWTMLVGQSGGGKLYRHEVRLGGNEDNKVAFLSMYSTKSSPYTMAEIQAIYPSTVLSSAIGNVFETDTVKYFPIIRVMYNSFGGVTVSFVGLNNALANDLFTTVDSDNIVEV